jgi:hypothetical protein
LKCERFDKLIHLFLDGRLEKNEKSELQEHLSTCERCARKLAFLKSMEGAAGKIEIEEPSQEYWDTFSSRIMEKISEREEKSLVFGLNRALQNIFSFSPLKMKVAAGLVSVVLVFIVGKLYVDYRGQEIVPRKGIIQTEEQPLLDVTKIAKKGEVSEAEDRDRPALPPDEPKREKKAVDLEEAKQKATPPGEPIAGEEMAPEELGALTAPEVAEERGAPALAPSVSDQTAAEGETPPEQRGIAPDAQQVGAGVEKEREKAGKIGIRVEEEKTGESEELSMEGQKKKPTTKVITESIRGTRPMERYMVNQVEVPKIEEDDTLMRIDSLTTTVQVWKDFIQESPGDPLSREGYLQVAIGYYLLGKLSQDTTIISEGTRVIEEYHKQSDDPSVKKELSSTLEKMKALKVK